MEKSFFLDESFVEHATDVALTEGYEELFLAENALSENMNSVLELSEGIASNKLAEKQIVLESMIEEADQNEAVLKESLANAKKIKATEKDDPKTVHGAAKTSSLERIKKFFQALVKAMKDLAVKIKNFFVKAFKTLTDAQTRAKAFYAKNEKAILAGKVAQPIKFELIGKDGKPAETTISASMVKQILNTSLDGLKKNAKAASDKAAVAEKLAQRGEHLVDEESASNLRTEALMARTAAFDAQNLLRRETLNQNKALHAAIAYMHAAVKSAKTAAKASKKTDKPAVAK